jgi:SNF2 family DNA or RNA helicase
LSLNNATKAKNSLMNAIMQLRKASNHPYLFDGAEPTFDGEFVLGDHLVNNR